MTDEWQSEEWNCDSNRFGVRGEGKPGECSGDVVCPAGGAAWLRLEQGGGVKGGCEPGREPPHPCVYPLPTSLPHALVSTSSLLHWFTLPSFEISSRPTQPLPFQAVPPAPPTLATQGGDLGADPCPAGAWDRVGDAGRNLGLSGGGCWCLLTPPLGVGSLGRGLGRGGSELEPCLSQRRMEQMAGEGRGYVAVGGGVRGLADEEPRISTARISQEKPPSPSFPRREGDSASLFLELPWPLAYDRHCCAVARPGARPSPPRIPGASRPAGSRPKGAAGVAWVNGAAL